MEPLSIINLLQIALTSSIASAIISGILISVLNRRNEHSKQLFDARIACYSNLLTKLSPMISRQLSIHEIQSSIPLIEEAMILSEEELFQELNTLYILLGLEEVQRSRIIPIRGDEIEFKIWAHDRMKLFMKNELGVKKRGWKKFIKDSDKELEKMNKADDEISSLPPKDTSQATPPSSF